MPRRSFARLLLQHWGIPVEDIPTSDRDEKQEADFLASFIGARVLIEEKTKEDDPDYLSARAEKLAQGGVHGETVPLVRNETLSGIIRDAAKQLRSSSDKPHDFRLIWFTATGVHAQAKYEQFMATLYGRTNILEMNADGYRRCYYFRDSDFFRRAAIIDGAVAAYTDGRSITAKLCLNSLSPKYTALPQSGVVVPFGTAVEEGRERFNCDTGMGFRSFAALGIRVGGWTGDSRSRLQGPAYSIAADLASSAIAGSPEMQKYKFDRTRLVQDPSTHLA